VAKFHYFAIKRSPQQHGQGTFSEKFREKITQFQEEKTFETTKIFGGIWADF
jgi:hypothetical protein